MNDNTQQVIDRACALITEAEATLANLEGGVGVDRVSLMTAKTMLSDAQLCVKAINRKRNRNINRTRRIQIHEP